MISTHFDPDIYAEGQNLQLYSNSVAEFIKKDEKTIHWFASLQSNTANNFQNNFFWGARDSKIIETVEWAPLTKTERNN